MSGSGATDLPTELSAEDHAYFLKIEALFNRFSQRTHLLTPADWHVARKWRRAGMPLDLIEKAMGEFFRQHGKRTPHDPIHSLRRLAPAVEAEWRQVRELTAVADPQGGGSGGESREEEPFDLPARLDALADQLPPDLPGRESYAQRIRNLTEEMGASNAEADLEAVDSALADLDTEIFQRAQEALDPAQKAGIEAAVTVAVRRLASRLPKEEIERARERLRQQIVRERLGLPWLSVF